MPRQAGLLDFCIYYLDYYPGSGKTREQSILRLKNAKMTPEQFIQAFEFIAGDCDYGAITDDNDLSFVEFGDYIED